MIKISLIILFIYSTFKETHSLPFSNLAAWYQFESTAKDQSGNGNDGTVQGASLTEDRFGNPNHAQRFDGVDDQIEIPSKPSLHPLNQLTISLWIKFEWPPTDYHTIFYKGGPHNGADPWGQEREQAIWYYTNGIFHFYCNDMKIKPYVQQNTNWFFLCIVVDRVNNQGLAYINDSLPTTFTDTRSTFYTNNNPLWLGNGYGQATVYPPFNGTIDDFRIQTRALSADEIRELQNEPNPVCTSNQQKENQICKNCNSSCLTCNVSASNCTECQLNLFFLNNSCYSICPDSQYINSTYCSACNKTCKTCMVSNNYCTGCQENYWILNNSCYSECPNGYYKANITCNNCNQSCKICESSQDNCSLRKENLQLLNNSCYFACPEGYQNVGMQCYACNSSCKTCSISKNNCTSCQNNNGFLNNICYLQCPIGQQKANLTCNICNESCTECEVGPNNCTKCQSPLYFLNSFCFTECPDGYQNDEKLCLSCNKSCRNCNKNENNCTSCLENYWLLNNSCYLVCPTGQYKDNLYCSICNSSCINCDFSQNNCLSCKSNLQLLHGSCQSICPETQQNDNSACSSCNANCKICSISQDNCTSCQPNFGYLNNTCYSICPFGYFMNNSYCVPCNSICKTCVNEANQCTSCMSGFAFLNFTCYSICPLKYYLNSSNCSLCQNTCETCDNFSNCGSCIRGFGFLNHSCQSPCPQEYQLNESKCESCNKSCGECTEINNCTKCKNNTGLLKGKCFTICPDGYYLSEGNCITCNSKCSQCLGPLETDCRKNILVSMQLIPTIDPMIFNLQLNNEFPAFYNQFDQLSFHLNIDVTKDNITNEIKLAVLLNEKSTGTNSTLSLFVQGPIDLDLDPTQILPNKSTAVSLPRLFPTTISEEASNLIGNSSQIITLVSSSADSITELLLAFNSVPIMAVSLSRLVYFTKFLQLQFPMNVLLCFKKQMEEKSLWRFLEISQKPQENWIPVESRFKQYNYSPLSWNNSNDGLFKIVLQFILYAIFLFMKKSNKITPNENNNKSKEKKDIIEKQSTNDKIRLFLYKLINITASSYQLVFFIAMMVNLYYLSLANTWSILSFILSIVLVWLSLRTKLFSFLVHYWKQKKINSKSNQNSKIMKVLHYIFIIPTTQEFLEETKKQEFVQNDQNTHTLIGFLYEPISLLRYLFFGFSLIVSQSNALFPIIVSLLLSILLSIWIFVKRPFRNWILTLQYLVIETLTLWLFSMLLALWIMDSTNQESEEGRNMYGYVFLLLNLLLQIIPVAFLGISSVFQGIQFLKGWLQKQNKKQEKIPSSKHSSHSSRKHEKRTAKKAIASKSNVKSKLKQAKQESFQKGMNECKLVKIKTLK